MCAMPLEQIDKYSSTGRDLHRRQLLDNKESNTKESVWDLKCCGWNKAIYFPIRRGWRSSRIDRRRRSLCDRSKTKRVECQRGVTTFLSGIDITTGSYIYTRPRDENRTYYKLQVQNPAPSTADSTLMSAIFWPLFFARSRLLASRSSSCSQSWSSQAGDGR